MASQFDRVRGHLDEVPIFRNHNVFPRNTQRGSQFCMQYQLPILSMNWYEKLWSHQTQHQLQFFLCTMPRNVYIGDALVKHISTLTEEAIDCAMHHLLISWDGSCRENDSITRGNADQAMILIGNARKGRSWLSLTASTDNDYLLWLE